MHRFLRGAAVVLVLIGICAPAVAGPVRPVPPIGRVLLVSVDGLRPDLALEADAPTLRDLIRRGSYSLWAQTTAIAVTLPSHTSMLTGVPPSSHGIVWNTTLPLKRQVYPAYPTLFEIARNAGYTTAMVAGKSKFAALAKPGTLSWSYVPDSAVTTDASVTDRAVDWIRRYAPQVLFVHLPDVDGAGHESGWGSAEQLQAIAGADRCIGRLLDALAARELRDSTLVLITADHGGSGTNHGADDPRSRTIPWIAAGPGVRAGYDLTLDEDRTIRTEDTFATLAYVLGLTPPRAVVGRPVLSIFTTAPEAQTQH